MNNDEYLDLEQIVMVTVLHTPSLPLQLTKYIL